MVSTDGYPKNRVEAAVHEVEGAGIYWRVVCAVKCEWVVKEGGAKWAPDVEVTCTCCIVMDLVDVSVSKSCLLVCSGPPPRLNE